MIMRQYLHLDPVAASYLFGCGGRAAAAVVDPIGEIGPYIDAADKTGMRILYVIDTICMPITFPPAAIWPRPPVPNTCYSPMLR
jgi:hypothetical protein